MTSVRRGIPLPVTVAIVMSLLGVGAVYTNSPFFWIGFLLMTLLGVLGLLAFIGLAILRILGWFGSETKENVMSFVNLVSERKELRELQLEELRLRKEERSKV